MTILSPTFATKTAWGGHTNAHEAHTKDHIVTPTYTKVCVRVRL